MVYVRKTYDEYQIHANYGYGWECEYAAEDKADARRLLKEYRENGCGDYRLVKRRIPKHSKLLEPVYGTEFDHA